MQERTVGDRIRLKRKEQHLSQEALAERMHLTGAIISNYENDKVDIKISVLRDLARNLRTTVSFLADGVENPTDVCEDYECVSAGNSSASVRTGYEGSINNEGTIMLRESELQSLIRIYSLIRTPRIRSVALEQMKILTGI